MAESIKSILDDECSNLKIDVKLMKRVREYGQAFVNKNADHVSFFGSNLLGVYPVRFRTSDKDEWFDDVIEADDISIRSRIISLPTVDESWVRGTDAMNLTCLWLTHRVFNSSMSQKQKEQAMIDALMVLHFKLISSLMAHNFKYPADKSVALATYAALSKKYAIKVYGSWYKLLEARCYDIIDKKSTHYRTLQLFDNDADIQYMITDIQGRLRSIVRNMWQVFDQIRTQDAKIVSTKGLVAVDGQNLVRDMVRNYTPFKRYIHEVAQDKTRFIKQELVQVTANAMYTMPEKLLVDSLEFISENYGKNNAQYIIEFIDETMLHAFEFLSGDKSTFAKSNDLAALITKLRAIYMSSRSTDKSLLKMRKLGEQIVKKSVKTKNPSTVAAIRTGLMLYIVIRAFTMQHYN
jgi:hypothetical protein